MFLLMTIDTENIESRDERLDSYLKAIAEGDNGAFAKLYEETHSAVFGFALSILKHQHDAEDAAQNTFVVLYTSATAYEAKGKPMAYIFTVTRNICLMKLREAKKTAAAPVEDYAELAFEDDHSLSTEDKVVLQTVLSVLSDDDLQIVMLHALAGMKFREIAHLLDFSISTVLSKYHRSMAKLKKHLTEEGQQ